MLVQQALVQELVQELVLVQVLELVAGQHRQPQEQPLSAIVTLRETIFSCYTFPFPFPFLLTVKTLGCLLFCA